MDRGQNRLLNLSPSLLLALLLVAFRGVCPAETTQDAAELGSYGAATLDRTLVGVLLDEISGLAASRVHPGHIWVHQDDLGDSRIYRCRDDGLLQQTVVIQGVNAIDFEDVALGPLPGGEPWGLFVGDIGDGPTGDRDSFTIHVLDERDTASSNLVTPVLSATITWPGSPRNAEALMVSPVTGDIFLLTRRGGERPAEMYRIAFDSWTNAATATPEAQWVASVPLPALGTEEGLDDAYEVTAADIDAERRSLAIRTKHNVYVYELTGEPSATQLQTAPAAILPTAFEPQGEALGFWNDSRDLLTGSEQSSQIHRFPWLGSGPVGVGMR